jgi:hypothetical protein
MVQIPSTCTICYTYIASTIGERCMHVHGTARVLATLDIEKISFIESECICSVVYSGAL